MTAELALKYIGPSAAVRVGAEAIARGETVVVPFELGEGLLAQGCSPAHRITETGVDEDGVRFVREVEVPEDRSGAQWETTKKQPKPVEGGEGSS